MTNGEQYICAVRKDDVMEVGKTKFFGAEFSIRMGKRPGGGAQPVENNVVILTLEETLRLIDQLQIITGGPLTALAVKAAKKQRR